MTFPDSPRREGLAVLLMIGDNCVDTVSTQKVGAELQEKSERAHFCWEGVFDLVWFAALVASTASIHYSDLGIIFHSEPEWGCNSFKGDFFGESELEMEQGLLGNCVVLRDGVEWFCGRLSGSKG